MSRSGLISPPAAERRDVPASSADPADGGYWRRPRRRVICLFITCAVALASAGAVGAVTGLRDAGRPAGHTPAHGTSASPGKPPEPARLLPLSGRGPAGTLPASVVPSAGPYAPTASAFPAGR